MSLKIYPRGEIVPLAITPDSAAQMIAAPGGSARPRSAMKPPEHALNRELLALLGAPSRESSILARYWGFDTRGPETLQRIGNDLGLTGERVRQIVDRQSTLALPGRVAAPCWTRRSGMSRSEYPRRQRISNTDFTPLVLSRRHFASKHSSRRQSYSTDRFPCRLRAYEAPE